MSYASSYITESWAVESHIKLSCTRSVGSFIYNPKSKSEAVALLLATDRRMTGRTAILHDIRDMIRQDPLLSAGTVGIFRYRIPIVPRLHRKKKWLAWLTSTSILYTWLEKMVSNLWIKYGRLFWSESFPTSKLSPIAMPYIERIY